MFTLGRLRHLSIFTLLLLACACGGSPSSPAADGNGLRILFVSPDGSNENNGTQSAPCLTIRHALTHLRAGDKLYLRGGVYSGPLNTIDSALGRVPSGTSWSNAVTIAGFPGRASRYSRPTTSPPFG